MVYYGVLFLLPLSNSHFPALSLFLSTYTHTSVKIVEGIKEEYLETVLPPIGGLCTVLSGTYRGQSAVLIEKRKEEGLAFIQLEDDLEGVLLSMDHIASRM